MSIVSKPSIAFHRKRLAGALAAVSLCMLLGACGNDDDKTPDPSTTSSTDGAGDNGGASQVLSANPWSASPAASASVALPAVTIQTPALPASSADAALSAAASTPLAAPVIHTVD